MTISKEIKTALLVITGIILFIFGYNYLKGKNLLSSDRIYYVVYDNVEGLSPSTPITINGLNVGTVQSIGFQDTTGKLLVTMNITRDFSFSKNSEAQLYQPGLIGGKSIAIIPSFDDSEEAISGSFLKGTVKAGITDIVSEQFSPLQAKMELMLVSADSVLTNINDVFDTQTKINLKKSIEKLNETITSFNTMSGTLNGFVEENKDKLSSTLDNVDGISANLVKISDSLVDANLGKTMQDLQKTIANFNEVLATIESGQGSIGKLLKDDKLYENLEGASKQLEELLEDMKLNPKRYVHFSLFGKKPKQYDADGNIINDKD